MTIAHHRFVACLLLPVVVLSACASAPTVTPTPTRVRLQSSPTATVLVPPSPSASQSPPAILVTPTVAPPLSPTAPQATSTPPPMATANPGNMTSPDYGIQVFLGVSPETREQALRLAKAAGFRWVKQDFKWSDIAPDEAGVFKWEAYDAIVDAVERAGLKLIARVGSPPLWAAPRADVNHPHNPPPTDLSLTGPLANFLFGLAARYKGRIAAYQIWNEPNLQREWGSAPDPATYARLLKVAYHAIKTADPTALVISAGPSPTGTQPPEALPDDTFVDQLYQAMDRHSSTGYFDLLGAHGAGYKAPPETSPDEAARRKDLGGARFFCFRRVEDLRAIMIKHGDTKTRIALLEFGWTTDNRPGSPYAWHGVSEQEQAEYIVRAYEWAKKNWPWVGVMTLIYIAHPNWTPNDEEYYWAITRPDGMVRPAYLRFQQWRNSGT